MELSLTTFILETVNFLVLVWILKRLFYIPVKKVIEDRRASVAKTLKDAQEMKNQSDQLQTQYVARLRDWETEKAAALEVLEKSLAEERAKRLKQIEVSVTSEREKMRAQDEKRSTELKERLEREAMGQSLEFATRLLSSLASQDLEASLVKIALEKFRVLKATTSEISITRDDAYIVRTAFSLSDDQKDLIRKAVEDEGGKPVNVVFSIEKPLIAGLEIVLGSTVVRANLRDELAYFSEARHP